MGVFFSLFFSLTFVCVTWFVCRVGLAPSQEERVCVLHTVEELCMLSLVFSAKLGGCSSAHHERPTAPVTHGTPADTPFIIIAFETQDMVNIRGRPTHTTKLRDVRRCDVRRMWYM